MDSKVHGANMGPIWDRQDPGGPNIGPINFAIWDAFISGLHGSLVASLSVRNITKKRMNVF